MGAKASISLKPKQQPKAASWTLAADDGDDELVDEDDLLTEEDRQRPAAIGGPSNAFLGYLNHACRECHMSTALCWGPALLLSAAAHTMEANSSSNNQPLLQMTVR